MSTFRLATINVHGFRYPSNDKSNISDLVSILEPLNLDFLGVEEVYDNDKWKKFCQDLSLPYFIHEHCNEYIFTNGIVSRHPILSHSNQSTNFWSVGGKRSMLQCRLGGDHPFVIDRLFGVTHLDYLNEDDRLKQIKYFNPSKENIDILMGDFNALTRDDYSDEYFKEIVIKKREKSKWEKPYFDLTKLITHQWDYQDAFKLINPNVKDEATATCAYGTRIDYIYVHPRVNDQWVLKKCSIIDTKGATDHHAVFAEFKRLEK